MSRNYLKFKNKQKQFSTRRYKIDKFLTFRNFTQSILILLFVGLLTLFNSVAKLFYINIIYAVT